MQQRLPSRREVPIAFAHRGARSLARENTIEAFRLALRLGANGLESDVWSTSDGVAILDHDGVVRTLLRKVPVGNMERSSLPSHIPSVVEFVESVGTNFHLSLDIKSGGAIAPLATALTSAHFPLDQLWLCSPDELVLDEVRAELPGSNLVHSTRLAKLPRTFEQHCARLSETGIGTVNLHHSEWNGGRVVMCHRFGLNAFGWDIQQPDTMENGVRMGLDGVYSDHVDMMVDVCTSTVGALPLPR